MNVAKAQEVKETIGELDLTLFTGVTGLGKNRVHKGLYHINCGAD